MDKLTLNGMCMDNGFLEIKYDKNREELFVRINEDTCIILKDKEIKNLYVYLKEIKDFKLG
jgi:hypothetical protein